MKIIREIPLHEFDTWSGANLTKDNLTINELDIIESCLIELYPNGMNEYEVNDFLWFETDTIAEWLGFNDWEDYLEYTSGLDV